MHKEIKISKKAWPRVYKYMRSYRNGRTANFTIDRTPPYDVLCTRPLTISGVRNNKEFSLHVGAWELIFSTETSSAEDWIKNITKLARKYDDTVKLRVKQGGKVKYVEIKETDLPYSLQQTLFKTVKEKNA